MSYLVQSHGMGTWKTRQIDKKSKGRQESGRSKGLIPTSLQRYMCRANRSWKHPKYNAVMTLEVNGGIFPRKGKKG